MYFLGESWILVQILEQKISSGGLVPFGALLLLLFIIIIIIMWFDNVRSHLYCPTDDSTSGGQ